MKTNNHLVIGMGQIGTSIFNVLKKGYVVNGLDKLEKDNAFHEDILGIEYDVVHICFGYYDKFESQVNMYKTFLRQGGLLIIHSTVPMGTSRKLNAVHSPIRGIHPNLEDGIKTIPKMFGGERAEEAAKIFKKLGIKTHCTPDQENTEVGKIFSTTGYGLNIAFEKIVHAYCKENDIDFEFAYSLFNKTYNLGYKKLGSPQYCKYNLKQYDGQIGGHCVAPNLDLLGNEELKEFILKERD